jgi:phage tail sheath gpL-like
MINTNIPNSLNRPATFHSFTFLYANRSLVSIPTRIGLIGAKSNTGTAVAGTVYEVVDATQTDALFGQSSELALMCRIAFACSAQFLKGPRVFACSIAEPGGGVANVKTITGTGSATADGNIIVTIAGRRFVVGVRLGDAQNTIATAIANVLKANQENLPVVVSVATNVVTLTHPTRGVNGIDVVVSVDQQVAGNALVVANTVTGTGVTDHQTALDAFSTLDYDGIVFSNHAAADITEIVADKAARWGAAEKRWRWYFLGEPGTIGTATALASAANSEGVIVFNVPNCPNTAGEMATVAAMLAFSRDRPNANYSGAKVPLFPPTAAQALTGSSIETAILAGLTVATPVLDTQGQIVGGQVQITRMITTKTTSGGQPFYLLRDLAVSRTGVYLARQLDIGWGERFSADANPDGTLLTDDVMDQVGDLAKSIMRAAGEGSIIRNVESDIAKLVYERDVNTIGRVNVDLWYTVVMGMQQIAWKHNVQV